MRYLAPAKLNLFLHILGRRADGYHDLETVFQLVDLCDELTINTRPDGRIVRHPPPDDPMLAALPDEDDLTIRAARLLQQAGATKQGANIHVRKQIPAGGGMGGGSSDAATVLLALNRQWSLNLPLSRLAELGLVLGSDVPVFVYGRTAFASGRGEVLEPIETPSRWFLVVKPPVMVATREIFRARQLTRDTAPLRIRALPADGGRNDCEKVVRIHHPEVAMVLDQLAPQGARLTGTGACVFVPLESRAAAEVISTTLPRNWDVWIVRGLSQTPHFPL
ncbi:MAG: 4-(cytidine 5'-diphospho)-2-C-methyl-D-erythritol kinase [Steroidobacteraceae bacterium]